MFAVPSGHLKRITETTYFLNMSGKTTVKSLIMTEIKIC